MALGALAALVRNSLAELALGLAILVVVGALGILIPGLHDQPVWPFPVRFSTDALDDPQLRNSIFAALAAIVISGLLAIAAVLWRRLRWPGIICAVLLIGYFAPTLRELTEPAYPTSFYGSPTGYSAQSIARGQSLFLENCAACHGPQGRGDGPAAQSLTTKPADLTAEHIYGHPDGDIFWWITHGKSGVMPAFGDVLDENARWNLIDFIHANADAVRLRAAAGQRDQSSAIRCLPSRSSAPTDRSYRSVNSRARCFISCLQEPKQLTACKLWRDSKPTT